MKYIDNTLFRSINNYFSTLSRLGYLNYNGVNKLIVLAFLEELLNGEFNVIVTEEEYRAIMNCFKCINGSECFIPYQCYRDRIPLSVVVPRGTFEINENCN